MNLKALYLLLFISIFAVSSAHAGNDNKVSKTRTVSGKVVDASGESLAGAKLVVAETGTIIYADMEGNFQLSIPTDKVCTIAIHTIGHQITEVKSNELFNFDDLVLKAL